MPSYAADANCFGGDVTFRFLVCVSVEESVDSDDLSVSEESSCPHS